MRVLFRFTLLALSLGMLLSVIFFQISAVIIGSGSDKVGTILLAMLLSAIGGFGVGVPLAGYVTHLMSRKSSD